MSEPAEKRPYLLRILGTWGVFLFLAVLFSIPLGPIPPLGNFLSPYSGYLKNAPSVAKKNAPTSEFEAGIKGKKITISVDTRGVPHVVAENDLDLAFGQGYATARDRLWQMELQTAATAGRVSELLGEKAFEFDAKQRRLGFLAAAEAELEFLQKNDPQQYEILEAYSEGVNAYIRSLTPQQWPVEYKLLGTSPGKWTPLHCALFHKQMTWTLTGNFDDFKMSNALQRFSQSELEFLFPDFYPRSTPILDASVANMSVSSPEMAETSSSPARLDGILKIENKSQRSQQEKRKPSNGSNNWVVDGTRTAHGYPLLANDPHLDLKLPSIWYEIQLSAPNVNVYGVSLPGLPHVIIGFNDSVSWGITNAGTDVIDWFAMKFDKAKPAPNYLSAQRWRPSTVRKEIIRIKGKPSRTIDVIETHLGPIAQELTLEQKSGATSTVPFAMLWKGHTPSNEFRVFHSLNRARTVVEMKNALRDYQAPGQNFVMADKTGSIGLLQAGRFPIRTSAAAGRFVLDGTSPTAGWKDDISFVHLPQSWSPERGHLSSANQQPTLDPAFGYASGDWGFTSYLRGERIFQKLNELTATQPASFSSLMPASISSLMQLQNDVTDLRAKKLLPLFSRWTVGLLRNDDDRKVLDMLNRWNFELHARSIEAAVWSKWWEIVHDTLWEKAFPTPDFKSPSEDKTLELLLSKEDSDWPASASVMRRTEVPLLVANSLERAVKTLRTFSERKNLPEQLPQWGEFRGTKIPHLANLPGFGIEHLFTGGDGHTVNATTDHHGPSWRMVVTWVDAQPRAWGVYPGGQSGHAGSPHYTNMIEPWRNGQLQELLFVQQGQLKEDLTLSRTVLEKQP
ncbi:MAG: hypothetical protein RL189_962 [Pseudomonadota bacterium]|jgi:penicillin amidase